ncbi:MAG: hypothetical protein S4CHLAM37_06680 [Chlamydiia bacterium]|nr:hypothetical protein [Chlamydiia bacterium]
MSATLPAASAQCLHRISHVTMSDGTGYDVNVVYRDDLGREIILPDGYDSHCMFRDHPKMKKEIDHQLKLIAESHAEVSGKKFSDISVIQIRDEGIYFDHSLVGNHGVAVKEDLNKAYKAEFGSEFDRVGTVWAQAKGHLVDDYKHHMKHVDEPFIEVPISLTNHEAEPEAYLARDGSPSTRPHSDTAPHVDTGPQRNPHAAPVTSPEHQPEHQPGLSEKDLDDAMSVLTDADDFVTPLSSPVPTAPHTPTGDALVQPPKGWGQTFGEMPGAVFNWSTRLPRRGFNWALGKTSPVDMGGEISRTFINEKADRFVEWLQEDFTQSSTKTNMYPSFKDYYDDKLAASGSIHEDAQRRFLKVSEETFAQPLIDGLAELRVNAFVKTRDGTPGIKSVIEGFDRLRKEAMAVDFGDGDPNYIAAYKNFIQLVIREQLEMALVDYFKRYYKGTTDSGELADEAHKIPKAHFAEVMAYAQSKEFCIQYTTDANRFKESIAKAINNTLLWGQFFI